MVKSGASSPPSPENNHHQPKYTGVRKRKWGKWVSEIRLPNSRERIWLGSYDSAEKAARAFDAALYCLRGPNANFNFRDNPPDIAGGRSLTPSEIQAVASRYANEEVNPTPVGVAAAEAEEETNVTTTGGEQNDMSSSTSMDSTALLDWSFLNMLDCTNNQEYGYYMTVMDNTSDGYYPPPPPPPPPSSSVYDDDLNGNRNENENTDGYSSYSNQSFLWNF